jgi:hypothetical protein
VKFLGLAENDSQPVFQLPEPDAIMPEAGKKGGESGLGGSHHFFRKFNYSRRPYSCRRKPGF